MTAEPIADRLNRLGLTQRQAASLCGISVRALEMLCQGRYQPHPAVLRLLELVEHVPGARGRLEALEPSARPTRQAGGTPTGRS